MFFEKRKPWPYFNVKISDNRGNNEIIKIQAKNRGMASSLALRKSEVCKRAGFGMVNEVEEVKKVAS